MKKNTILHKIGQLIDPLKRTMSPLEADSHSAYSGHFFNRSLLLLLLSLTLGVNVAWGHDVVDGVYYISNNNTGGPWYLWPAITVTKDGSNFLYSYKYLTTHDGTEADAVENNNNVTYPAHDNSYCHWVVKNEGDYIQLINPRLNKYVVIVKNHTLATGKDVKLSDEPTGTDVDYSYFVLNETSGRYKISPPSPLPSTVSYSSGKETSSDYTFNSKSGNPGDRTWLTWSGTGNYNKPQLGEQDTGEYIKGLIQFYHDGKPTWQFTPDLLAAPTLTMDDASNKVTVTDNNDLPEGYTIRYTSGDGTQDPPTATTDNIITSNGYDVETSTTLKVVLERYGVVLTAPEILAVSPITLKPSIGYNCDTHEVIIESDGAENVYYTNGEDPDINNVDGDNPTKTYSSESKPTISAKTTIKAIAQKAGRRPSLVSEMLIYYDPVSLSKSSVTYGETMPTVYVKDGDDDIDQTKYTVKYLNSENVEVDECIVPGTYTIVVEDVEGDNEIVSGIKTFTINKADLTVKAKDKTIIYGETPANDGVTYDGFVNSETPSVLGGSLAYVYNYERYGDVGDNFTITPSGLTSDNYEITFTPGILTVTQREVGLTWDPLDSSTPIATYDGLSHAPTVTATNVVNSDDISVTMILSANEGSSLIGTDAINAGSYTATAALEGTKASNYSLPAENSQPFTISSKPVTVSGITVSDKPYDGTTDATIDFDGAAIDGIVLGDDLSVASVTGSFDTKDVGTGKTVSVVITFGGTSASNYELSASGLTATISPKPLTIKANDNTIDYGTVAEDNGVTYDSFVTGEETLLEGTLTYTFNTLADGTGDAYTPSSPRGTYFIIPDGLHLPDGNNNYTISFANGILTVAPRKIGNGTDLAEGFTVNIDTSTSPYDVTLYDGSIELIQGTTGTDYDYSIDTSESTDKYYVATITGANNYSDAVADRAIVKYANVKFDSDGSPGAMWYGTFVAEADHVTPTGMTPYIITSVADNTATAVELDYIPNGVPVVLMNPADAKGFQVQPRNGGEDADVSDNKLVVQDADEEKATAVAYLLYKGEFVLNKAGTFKAGTVYLPVSAGGGSGARLKISRGGNTGIENIEYTIKPQSDAWYTLDGRRLSSKPTKKGIYLQSGKKIVVK